MMASKAKTAKKRAKLSSDQRKLLADMKEKKQVGNFMMPDAPESKKGKRSDSRIWIPCPLLPGVPAVPPPRKPQPWEVLRSHETIAEAMEAGQSADTFAPNPVMERTVEDSDHDVTEGTPPETTENRPLLVVAKDEGKRKIHFSPSLGVIQATDPPLNPVWANVEVIGFTPQRTVEDSDHDVTEGTPPETTENRPLLVVAKDEGKRKIHFSPSLGVIQATDPPLNPVWANVEVIGFTPQRTVEDSDHDVTEGTPPETTENRPLLVVAKDEGKRKIHFSPSLGVIQATDPPLNPVWANVEVIGFTPHVDIERELTELDDSGSEIEGENNLVDTSLRQRNVSEYPAEFADLDDPTLAEAIQLIGAEADVTLRGMASPDDGDLLFFDWRGDLNNFEGVREIFTDPSGPTFEVTGLTPLEVLKKIWDDDIIDHIVRETNRYAHQMQVKVASKINSRISRWRDTTREEIWRFFTIIMLQSLVVNNVEREYWYPSNEQLRIGAFGKIMSFNRFILLKRCLHFVDNTFLPKNPSKLDKVMPVIKHLNKKFSTLYLPEQNVAIDESLLLWKGRLSFAQLIATKRAKVGIKSYELCESRTGYLWRMEVYSGKGHVHAPQEAPQEAIEGHEVGDEPERATSQIVYTLMRPLFGKGHTVVMDNFYNAPLLSRLLKTKHKTDTMGTLRLNREFVPETLKCKNKQNMKEGEVCFSMTKDLSVVVWKDKNVVAMISTFHQPEVGGKEKYGYYKYKPKVVLDYNLSMGGVDHKDQMLHAFPIERVRNICWYKKLYRRLVNVSVHNSLVIYNHDRTQQSQVGNRDFRLQLVRELLQLYSPRALIRPESPSPESPSPAALSQLHLPAKNQKNQRCKLCHESKVRRTTVWSCSTCQVNLCIEKCYTAYHAKYVCK